MASTTYRVIQDHERPGRVTGEQVAQVIREFLAGQVTKPVPVKKSNVSSKPRPARSKR